KRRAIYGPEPWHCDGGAPWSHWDLWFCLVALLDHDGDLVALGDAIEDEHRFYGHSDTEAKLSHLDDLADRLGAADLDAEALAVRAEDQAALRTKARTKVLKQGLQPRALTDAMRLTPRKRLYERALRRRWDRFPASPQPWYDRMVHHLGEGWLHKNATFRLARRIESTHERNERATANDPAQRLAATRALVTYMYETMERCDDSYGVLGGLGREALLTYARLPLDATGIAATDWCEDLCELLAWEQYGLVMRSETAMFANIHGALADHAEHFLLALAAELGDRRLRYEADEALQHIAHLHIAHGRLTRFTPIAARLGSDHWRPIVAMAQAAVARDRDDVARAIFAAADQPGMQQDYLRKRCRELTGAAPTSGAAPRAGE
ncbi:MAG: hypothetical protein M3370_00230, partial [Actinomycetota bacterium]|nr:hypothetical protein [Actinomycetota bacterium]